MTQDEGRYWIGLDGKAPGVTPEVEKIFTPSNPFGNESGEEQNNDKDDKKQDKGAKNNKKVQEPKNRDGREPTKYAEEGKK